MPTLSIPPPPKKKSVCLEYRLFIYVHSFSRDFWLQFWVAVATGEPPILGNRKPYGSGMVPFERALLTSYRLSIVTFSLSLRVSEILPLLFPSTPFSPTSPLVSPKFPHVSLGVDGSPFRYKERRCRVNSVQLVSKISNLPVTIHQRHRQTDRWTTYDRKTAFTESFLFILCNLKVCLNYWL